jgi:copper homeostasis protein
MLLEVACFNPESCLIAQKAGAKRIELCENYSEGGITPNEEIISRTRKELQIDLFIMIRPRKGDFIYSDLEIEEMRAQIEFCKEEKCDGVVFGILNEENKVDVEICKELVELAKPMQCTFHRAFDEIKNSEEALEAIIKCGFTRILTSGKHKTAQEGIEAIQQLIHKAKDRITIMPGGGIRSSTISELLNRTVATEFHSAAITDKSEIADASEIKKIISAF